jgi:hypothetical protein
MSLCPNVCQSTTYVGPKWSAMKCSDSNAADDDSNGKTSETITALT